jgi:hypothetical protein
MTIKQMQLRDEIFIGEIGFFLTGLTILVCTSLYGAIVYINVVDITVCEYRHICFYIYTLIYSWISAVYPNETWYLLLNSLTLLSQIIHNEVYVVGSIF